MEARDFRSIGRAAQEELRRRALVLVEQGASQGEAARAVGVQRQTVNLWLKRYRTQGEAGVLDGRRVSPRRGQGRLPPRRPTGSGAGSPTSCPIS